MLEDLGNLGDFLGGLAVIITLAYLTLQVRQNTASAEAAAIQTASHSFADAVESFARDPEILRIYTASVQDFDSLGPEDRQRFAAIMGGLLHRFEGFLVLTDRGILPQGYWDGAANRIRGLSRSRAHGPGGNAAGTSSIKGCSSGSMKRSSASRCGRPLSAT